MRAALLSPERERWAGSRDARLRRRGELGWGTGHARGKKRKGGSGPAVVGVLLGWFVGPGEEGKAGPVWEKGLGLSERSGPRDWV